MKVWITIAFEPLPGFDGDVRRLRGGLLAESLIEQGHEVRLWTSSFDHFGKRQRVERSQAVRGPAGETIELLFAEGYPRNRSFARVRHNRGVAQAFRSRAEQLGERPDLIFANIPTLELSEAAVQFASVQGVPVVVDVADRWPDVYLLALPAPLRPAARAALSGEYRRLRRVLHGAAAITAVSQTYLKWGLDLAGHAEREGTDVVFPLGFLEPEPGLAEQAGRKALEWRARLGIEPGMLVVSYLGQFGASYDVTTPIVAARRLAENGRTDVRFVMAGAGDQEAALRALAEGLPNVVFTGWLDQVDSLAVLQCSSVGLAAYAADAYQSLPYKPFQYLACGLPVVSSLQGELAGLLEAERVGVGYTAGDAASLVHALEPLANGSGRLQAMQRAARRLFLERFDARAVYPRLARHLESLAGAAETRLIV